MNYEYHRAAFLNDRCKKIDNKTLLCAAVVPSILIVLISKPCCYKLDLYTFSENIEKSIFNQFWP